MRFITAFIIMIILFGLMDLYFLRAWKNFIISRNFKPIFYKIMYWFSGAAFVLLVYNIFFRLIISDFHSIQFYSFVVISIWYFPKFVIVPAILIKDLTVFIKKKISKKEAETTINHTAVSRRKMLQTAGWLIAGAPYLIVAKGAIHTPYNLKLKKTTLYLNNLPASFDGFKICQLSDIHAGSFPNDSLLRKAVSEINDIQPDIAVITGDFVNFNPKELFLLKDELSKIKSKLGNFGCLGNHDHYMSDEEHSLLKELIKQSNINLLVNENINIYKENDFINLAGIDDLSFHNQFGDIGMALNGADRNTTTILLAHDPNVWDKHIVNKESVDLMLSGHTHGGQLRLDLGVTEIAPAKYMYKRWTGLYSENGQYLYVNDGFGTTGPPIRIGIPPEITLITLKRKFA